MKKKNNTSWGSVAEWYDEMLENDNSFQKNVILPNILRLMNIPKGEQILDLACGTGYFSREFARLGAKVTGVDIGKELIDVAKTLPSQNIEYIVSSADQLAFLKNQSFDTVVCVLAIQNIANVEGVLKEIKRILKPQGRIFFVLNHPAFRIPKQSSWGVEEISQVQYRRIDGYLSESKIKIDMHPGEKVKQNTISFHRSLQYFFKHFFKQGFGVVRLEEWISHRQGPKGKLFAMTEKARKEIPLFVCLELRNFS